MLQVPLLEQQGQLESSQFEFYYDRIQLVACSQSRYDAMWSLVSDLRATDYELFAILRTFDKIKSLTEQQQIRMEQLVPELKLQEYMQDSRNSQKLHDKLQQEFKIKHFVKSKNLKDIDVLSQQKSTKCHEKECWVHYININDCFLKDKYQCLSVGREIGGEWILDKWRNEYTWIKYFDNRRRLRMFQCRGCNLEICSLCMLRWIKLIDPKGFRYLIKEAYKNYDEYLLRQQNKRKLFFRQAYPDLPKSVQGCNSLIEFFQQNYDVSDDQISRLYNTNIEHVNAHYKEIKHQLKEEKQNRIRSLFIHVFAGHSMERDRLQTLMLNQPDMWAKEEDCKRFDEYNNFYMCFEAEKQVRELAAQFPSSFHIALFSGFREPEEEKYEYFSKKQTRIFTDSIINIILRKEDALQSKVLLKTLKQSEDQLVQTEAKGVSTYLRQLSKLAMNKINCQDFNRLLTQLSKVYHYSKSHDNIESKSLIKLLDLVLAKVTNLNPIQCSASMLTDACEYFLHHMNSQKGFMQNMSKPNLVQCLQSELDTFLLTQLSANQKQDVKVFYVTQGITAQEKLEVRLEQRDDKTGSVLDKLPQMTSAQLQNLFDPKDSEVDFPQVSGEGNYIVLTGTKCPLTCSELLPRMVKLLKERQDKIGLFIPFPKVFNQMIKADTTLKLNMSYSIQQMKLYHKEAYFWYYQKQWMHTDKDGNTVFNPIDPTEDLLRIDGHGNFKVAPDFWLQKPSIIAQQQVEIQEHQLTQTEIVHLPWQGLIMRIVTVGCWVQFSFYSAQAPYKEKNLKHNMKTEGRVSLVNDLRSDAEKKHDDLYVVQHENQDMKVVKLTVTGSAEYEDFGCQETTLKNNYWVDYWKGLVNSYVLNGNIFLFLIADRVMLCDQQFNYLDIFQPELGQLKCCSPGHNALGTQFLLGFVRSDRTLIAGFSWKKLRKMMRDPNFRFDFFMARLSKEEIIKVYELVQEEKHNSNLIATLSLHSNDFKKLTKQYALGFDGNSDQNTSSVIIRCSFDNMPWSYEHKIQDFDDSIFLKRETVCSIYEYAKSKVLIATENSVLLFHGQQFVKTFDDLNTEHVPKGELNTVDYFIQLPEFNEETFPFVACSRPQGISLLNLNQSHIETLIIAQPTCERGQPALFFTPIESGFNIHFTNRRNLLTGVEKLEWVKMPFNADFINTLAKSGYLPCSSTQKFAENFEELLALEKYNSSQPKSKEKKKNANEKVKQDLSKVKRQIKKVKKAIDEEEVNALEKEVEVLQHQKIVDLKIQESQKLKAKLQRREDILDSMIQAIDQNRQDRENIMQLLASVESNMQAKEMVEIILKMHAHDNFQQSNQQLQGLKRGDSKSLRDSQSEKDDDEVVMKSPKDAEPMSTFSRSFKKKRPIKLKLKSIDFDASSSCYSDGECPSPTLRLNREKLNELVQTLTLSREQGGNFLDVLNKETFKKNVKSFFLSEIRRDTQIVTIKTGQMHDSPLSRNDSPQTARGPQTSRGPQTTRASPASRRYSPGRQSQRTPATQASSRAIQADNVLMQHRQKEVRTSTMWKVKEYHWYLTHGQRNKIWHPTKGFFDTKQFGAFTKYSEMQYAESHPDERGGGTIEPQKITARFEHPGLLQKPVMELSLDSFSWKQVNQLSPLVSPRRVVTLNTRCNTGRIGSPK